MSKVSTKELIHTYVQLPSVYRENFEELRLQAKESLENTVFPTKKDEEWRFTDLKSITANKFESVKSGILQVSLELNKYHLPEAMNSRLVFINGNFSPIHSSVEGMPDGVIVSNLNNFSEHEQLRSHLGAITNYEDDVFVPLNDVNFQDGTFIYVPKQTFIEQPIHILNVFTDLENPYFVTPRVLFVGEMYSKATIIEEHIGLSNNVYLNIPVNEFRLYSGAHVHHARIQRDSKNASHISRPVAMLDAHAEYHSYTICLGAKLFRNEPRVIQNEEEVDFTVDGLVLIDGEQIADTHSVMDHRFSHGNSHQLHKVVVNDQAHSIFNGKIFVAKDAQKIDSFQENRNLLISDTGKVNTKPQLEIFADDVRCSHGATIGQLQDEEVFYLQSRGLTEQKSRELLVYAFALESVESMAVKSVEELLLKEVIAYTNRD
ncbi:MAG: Fe-S cluster assembly protein SufD [Balneola sp.]|nr:Fe-S cluster assembly protein SufD [Balneola sp.]|tara:strand:- start:54 stop:1349 length:1296 start_codon:yes stop_codon:yes gene_type:complete